MHLQNKPSIIVLSLGLILLTGCGAAQPSEPTQSPEQIYTQVAATVQANITLTALAMPTNTITPEPTITMTPTLEILSTNTPQGGSMPSLTPFATTSSSGDQKAGDHAILGYQAPADNATYSFGENFMLTWGFLNTGTTTWKKDEYTLRWFGGDKLWSVTSMPMPKDVKPGEKAEFNLRLFVPDTARQYITRWGLYNSAGQMFYEVYYTFTAE